MREEKTDIKRLYSFSVKAVACLKPYSLAFYTLHVGPQVLSSLRNRILLSIKSTYSRKPYRCKCVFLPTRGFPKMVFGSVPTCDKVSYVKMRKRQCSKVFLRLNLFKC